MIGAEKVGRFFGDEADVGLKCGLAEAEFYELHSSHLDQHLAISWNFSRVYEIPSSVARTCYAHSRKSHQSQRQASSMEHRLLLRIVRCAFRSRQSCFLELRDRR